MSRTAIYTRCLVPASQAPDGETPTLLRVVDTPDLNRPLVLEFSSAEGMAILAAGYNSNTLIELAVTMDPDAALAGARAIAEIQAGLERSRS